MIIHMNTMSNSDVHVCHCYTTIIHSLLIIIYSDGSCTWKIHVRSVYCTVLCIPSANDIIVCASLDFHSDKASNMQTSLHTSLHAAIMDEDSVSEMYLFSFRRLCRFWTSDVCITRCMYNIHKTALARQETGDMILNWYPYYPWTKSTDMCKWRQTQTPHSLNDRVPHNVLKCKPCTCSHKYI